MNFEDIEMESTNQQLQTSVQDDEQQRTEPVEAQTQVEEQSVAMPTARPAVTARAKQHPEPVQTARSGRVVRKPAYLKDFQT